MISYFTLKNILGSAVFIFAAWACLSLVFSRPATALEMASIDRPSPFALETQRQEPAVSALEQRLIEEGLVNVRDLDDSIMVNLKYAREDNFMGMNVYGDFIQAYLRPEAAEMLVRANRILRERHPHLCILVADALRPRSIQHKMWEKVVGTPMQRYVANPHTGSMHNYGGAVDVSLYDTGTGEMLDMGTPLDFFGPLAQPKLEDKYLQEGKLNEQQIANRLMLRDAMRDAGWQQLAIEWWHYTAFSTDYIRQNYTIIE